MKVAHLTGASRRLEALTDGIMAIVSTLLVLEIRVPEASKMQGEENIWPALRSILPSLLAFTFSFLNILVFWFNHDSIGKMLRYFDRTISFLNIFFLLFISLVPFTSALIAEYPESRAAVAIYGLVLFLASLFAAWMYNHIAFHSDMLDPQISIQARRRVWRKVMAGPVAFLVAMLLVLLHPFMAIAVYLVVPLFFFFLPSLDFTQDLTVNASTIPGDSGNSFTSETGDDIIQKPASTKSDL